MLHGREWLFLFRWGVDGGSGGVGGNGGFYLGKQFGRLGYMVCFHGQALQ